MSRPSTAPSLTRRPSCSYSLVTHAFRPPIAAAVYFNDMYVPRELSLPTAAAIGGLNAWVTSEYEHDGLRVSDGAVLGRLIELARGLAY